MRLHHPGNRPDAEAVQQARFVLELLCRADGRVGFRDLHIQADLTERQLEAAIRYLNSLGYIQAKVSSSLRMEYAATILGRDAADLVADLEGRARELDLP